MTYQKLLQSREYHKPQNKGQPFCTGKCLIWSKMKNLTSSLNLFFLRTLKALGGQAPKLLKKLFFWKPNKLAYQTHCQQIGFFAPKSFILVPAPGSSPVAGWCSAVLGRASSPELPQLPGQCPAHTATPAGHHLCQVHLLNAFCMMRTHERSWSPWTQFYSNTTVQINTPARLPVSLLFTVKWPVITDPSATKASLRGGHGASRAGVSASC